MRVIWTVGRIWREIRRKGRSLDLFCTIGQGRWYRVYQSLLFLIAVAISLGETRKGCIGLGVLYSIV